MTARETTARGALLRRYRLAAGLTQEALATRTRLSVTTIAALERGRHANARPETWLLLTRALGLDPDERAAFLEAAEGATASASDSAARPAPPHREATASPVRVHALPIPPTALIGRERDEAIVTRLLTEEGVRLLTLTGPGGVGKTRLALAVAAILRPCYADGAIFVDLSALRDPALVASTVGEALGLRETGAQSRRELLLTALRAKHLLLVLDNFEQVVEAAPLVAEMVAACPAVVMLVTSRASLRLRAERQFRVPPLETPPLQQPVDALANYGAVRLFVARAQAADPDFRLDADNVAAVIGVCRRLDGLPLAIELAAARVVVLSPRALLARLEQRLTVATGGARDLPARQRTVRATIDWSYSLLREDEQRLFCRLGIFAGGCTEEAVERICDPHHQLDVVACLSALWDMSLLRREDATGDEPRLSLLETLRAYALEQLAARGEDAALRAAHAGHYLALAEAATPHLRGPEQMGWLDRLEREHANLRAALAWACEQHEGVIGLRLAVALWPFWRSRGYLSEGRGWLERLLAISGGSSIPATLRADALTGAAWLAQPQHDYAAAIPWLEESQALRRTLGLPDAGTDLLIQRALQARAQGDYRQAVRLLEESVARHRAAGNREGIGSRGLGLSLACLGMVLREHGDPARAILLYQECLALHGGLGDPEGRANALLGLGDSARDQGDTARVRTYCAESHAIFTTLGNRWGMAVCLNNLALAAFGQDDLAGARSLAERSVAVSRDLGSEPTIAEALLTLSWIAAAHGDAASATTALAESLLLLRARGPRYLVPSALEVLASLTAVRDQAPVAARLLGVAAGLRGAIGAALPLVFLPVRERTLAAVRAALGQDAFAAAWSVGQTLPLDQAIEEALALCWVPNAPAPRRPQ